MFQEKQHHTKQQPFGMRLIKPQIGLHRPFVVEFLVNQLGNLQPLIVHFTAFFHALPRDGTAPITQKRGFLPLRLPFPLFV